MLTLFSLTGSTRRLFASSQGEQVLPVCLARFVFFSSALFYCCLLLVSVAFCFFCYIYVQILSSAALWLFASLLFLRFCFCFFWSKLGTQLRTSQWCHAHQAANPSRGAVGGAPAMATEQSPQDDGDDDSDEQLYIQNFHKVAKTKRDPAQTWPLSTPRHAASNCLLLQPTNASSADWHWPVPLPFNSALLYSTLLSLSLPPAPSSPQDVYKNGREGEAMDKNATMTMNPSGVDGIYFTGKPKVGSVEGLSRLWER
jgi:hypothetical protein